MEMSGITHVLRRRAELREDCEVHDHDEDDVHVKVVVQAETAGVGRDDEQHWPEQHRAHEEDVHGGIEVKEWFVDTPCTPLEMQSEKVEIAEADPEEGLQREERLRHVACGRRVEADADVVVGEDVVDAVAALRCEEDVGVPDARADPRARYHEEEDLERRLQVELRPSHSSLPEVGSDNLVESGAPPELFLDRQDFLMSAMHH